MLDFLKPVVDYVDNQERMVVLRSSRQFNAGQDISVRISVPGQRRPAPTRVTVCNCRPLEAGGFALAALLADGHDLPAVQEPPHADDAALRQSARLACHICVLSKDLPGYRAVTVDYSPGGVQIEVPGRVEVGSTVLMRLDFDVHTLPALECRARVAWCSRFDEKRYRVGLQFVNLDDGSLQVLRRFEDILKGRDDTNILHRLLFGDGYGQAPIDPDSVPPLDLPAPPVEVKPVTGSIHEGLLWGYARNPQGVSVFLQTPAGTTAEYRFVGQRGLIDHVGAGSREHEIGDLLERPSADGCTRFQFIDRWRQVVLEVVAASYTRD